MTDGCCLDFVRRAVAHICRSAGWNCISQSAHDTLTDVLLLYVESSARIAQTCSRHCQFIDFTLPFVFSCFFLLHSASRTMPTLDDVAFSIRHIGASLSELLSQPEDLPAHDIQTVWDKLPASYLTHSLVESEQAGISLDMVERQPSENVKDSTSVIYSNEANFSYEGAESHSVSGHGSHLQVLAAFNPEVNVNDISPVDNIEMKPIDHDLVEVSDPWEWPSVVKAIDLTHKASTSASKQLLVQSDKKLPKPEPTAESPVPVRSSTFSSENIKTEERNSTEKTVAPMLVHTTDDQRVIFSNRDQQNQTAVAQLDHHKIKSHFGNDAQAQTQERVVGGSKAALFKIPKLKLKVGAHGESPSDSGQMSHLAVELDPKHQKIKKKKRKAKDIDKESRKSGLSKLPKKAKHKDKAKQVRLPPLVIVLAKNLIWNISVVSNTD